VSLFLESLARRSRNQAFSSTIRGRLRSWRTRRRPCGARPLISRSMANRGDALADGVHRFLGSRFSSTELFDANGSALWLGGAFPFRSKACTNVSLWNREESDTCGQDAEYDRHPQQRAYIARKIRIALQPLHRTSMNWSSCSTLVRGTRRTPEYCGQRAISFMVNFDPPAWQLRQQRSLPKGTNLREKTDIVELSATKLTEALASRRMHAGAVGLMLL
jgi:hypothetical protein